MGDSKIIFDTNVLLINPALITRFSKRIVFTKTILSELDYRKNVGAHQENAQLAINNIDKDTIKVIRVAQYLDGNNDEKILSEALSEYQFSDLLMVSEDTGMRLAAKSRKIKSITLEEFEKDISKNNFETIQTREKQLLYETLLKQEYLECQNMLNTDPKLNFNFYLNNGFTPLIECIKKKKGKLVDFIIAQKSTDLDLSDKAKLKMPAFLHASQHRNIGIMKNLCRSGVNHHITVKGRNLGNSPLLIAAYDNALNVIEFLLETPHLEISVNQSDGNGFTALIKASFRGHYDIVKYLIKKKADPYIRDKRDKSALEHALENDNLEIAALITNYLKY